MFLFLVYYMPQLDIFIFSHIIIQATVAFLLVALIIWNTALINLFTSLKTRDKYLKLLTTEIGVPGIKKVIKENAEIMLIEPVIIDFIKQLNNEK